MPMWDCRQIKCSRFGGQGGQTTCSTSQVLLASYRTTDVIYNKRLVGHMTRGQIIVGQMPVRPHSLRLWILLISIFFSYVSVCFSLYVSVVGGVGVGLQRQRKLLPSDVTQLQVPVISTIQYVSTYSFPQYSHQTVIMHRVQHCWDNSYKMQLQIRSSKRQY